MYVTGELKRERSFERATAVTGELRTWHRSGELKERRHRKARRWVRLHEKFYPDGAVRMIGQWDRGARHGTWKWYHPSGRLRLEIPYEHGAVDGSLRLWRDNGELVLEIAVWQGIPVHGWLERVEQVDEVEFLEWDSAFTIYDSERRPVVSVMMTGVPGRARGWPRDFDDTDKPWWST